MNSSSQTTARSLFKSEIAGVAGFFDAEGCICGSVINGYGHLTIEIRNKNLSVLTWVQTLYGGEIRKVNQTLYSWSPQESTKYFLKSIKQFLITKRAQTECALAYISLPKIAPKKRVRLAEKIAKINKKRLPLCLRGEISRGEGRSQKIGKTAIAYTALFLEGDGRLKDSQCYFCGIYRPTLEYFQSLWGGTLSCVGEVGEHGLKNPYYRLLIPDDKKLRLLTLISPYLHGKKKNVEEMIKRLKG